MPKVAVTSDQSAPALPADLSRDPHAGRIKPVVTIGIFHGGKVLMFRRSKPPYSGYWELAGGGLELNERLEECARREVEEEAGFTAKDVGRVAFAGFYEFLLPNNYHRLLFCYAFEVSHDNVILTEHDECGWFDPKKLPEPMIPFVREEVRDSAKALGIR